MKSKDFEEESAVIGGWLWDETWSEDYNVEITLTISELRFIANLMREKEGREIMQPVAWSEAAVKLSRV